MKNFRKLLLTATLISIFSTLALAGGSYCPPPPPSNCPPPPPASCPPPSNSCGSLLGNLSAQVALCLSVNLRLW